MPHEMLTVPDSYDRIGLHGKQGKPPMKIFIVIDQSLLYAL